LDKLNEIKIKQRIECNKLIAGIITANLQQKKLKSIKNDQDRVQRRSRTSLRQIKKPMQLAVVLAEDTCRGEWIRTTGLLLPKQAR
jgi:hypothetical protein